MTISALITNTGNVTSTYEAILKIDNAVVATESITLVVVPARRYPLPSLRMLPGPML